MTLWGGKVTEGKPLLVEAELTPLHLTRAALAGTRNKSDKASATVLSLTIGGESYVIGTLRPGQVEQLDLGLNVHGDSGKSYYLNVEGPGEVHVTGELIIDYHDDYSLDDSEMGEEGEGGLYGIGASGSSDDGEGDEMELDDQPKKKKPTSIRIEEVTDSKEDAAGLTQGKKGNQGASPKTAASPKTKPAAGAGSEKKASPGAKPPAAAGAAAAAKKGKVEKEAGDGLQGKKRPAEGAPDDATPNKKQKTEGTFKCPQCDRNFTADKGLQQHLKDKHKPAGTAESD